MKSNLGFSKRGFLRRIATTLIALVVIAASLAVAPAAFAGGDKTYQYTFNFVNGESISGTSTGNVAFLRDAGGRSVDNPTGMDVHISCSDDFPGGWGEKDGPEQGVDTAWQVESYTISKMKGGKVDKTCGDAFVPAVDPDLDPPAIDIEKYVNNDDADSPTGPRVDVGDAVNFTYLVTNTGGVALRDVVVTDSILGAVTCPETNMAVGASMWCTPMSTTVDNAGQYTNEADVVAIARLTPGAPPVINKGHGYSFTFVNGITINGTNDSNTVFVAGAGGRSADNPTGMDMHVSCSDKFPGGWGEKDGPEQGVDTAWQVASFTINKYKNGRVDKTCGDTFAQVDTEVSDNDPVNYIADNTPEPPRFECESTTVNGVPVLSWTDDPEVASYAIFRNGTWITRTKANTYTDHAAPAGVKVTYQVRAIGHDGTKSDKVDCGMLTPPEPPRFECELTTVNGVPVLSWTDDGEAASYAIFRNGDWVVRTKSTSFTDFGAPAGVTLSYQIRPIGHDGTKGDFIDCGTIAIGS